MVRTALESLVAKNQAQRVKQGRSIYYIVSDPTEETAATIQGEPADSEKTE
ncbi:hypothetical protein ACWEQ2_41805 [Streptomyces sp. NPDC004096]